MAVDQQGDESILQVYRDFLRFRRDHAAMTTGSIEKVEATEQVLSFERVAEDERLVCLFNMSDQTAEIALDPNSITDSDWPHAAERTNAGLKLPPLGAYIGVIG